MTTATITDRLEGIGKPAWIALTVLGFVIWWPLGLAALAFILWSGRMSCHAHRSAHWERKMERMHEKLHRVHEHVHGGWRGEPRSSGNSAFDEYKAETLKRLEDEQHEFQEFLRRLRASKDRAEFDQFMGERRGAGEPPAPQPEG
jgi:hypothetical protein